MAKYSQGKYIPVNMEKYLGSKAPTYRSSWEFTFMKFCDNNPAIVGWSSEGIKIPYFNPVKGKNTIYVPDFLIVYEDKNGKKHTEIIEIKPAKETSMASAKSTRDKYMVAINMAKWASCQAYCNARGMKFRIITEHQLFRNAKK